MARATASSLKVHNLRASRRRAHDHHVGHPLRLKYSMPRQTSSPTRGLARAREKADGEAGKRRERMWTMSAMAAPRGEVTMPMRRGTAAAGACDPPRTILRPRVLLELLEGQLQRAQPALQQLHCNWYSPRPHRHRCGRAPTRQAVGRLELPVACAERKATHLSWASRSLRVNSSGRSRPV